MIRRVRKKNSGSKQTESLVRPCKLDQFFLFSAFFRLWREGHHVQSHRFREAQHDIHILHSLAGGPFDKIINRRRKRGRSMILGTIS